LRLIKTPLYPRNRQLGDFRLYIGVLKVQRFKNTNIPFLENAKFSFLENGKFSFLENAKFSFWKIPMILF
jgi:hypothetical protein